MSFLACYETTKLVRIHNKFLGVLYYSLFFLILVGQLGLVVYNRDYLEYDSPKGIVRPSIKTSDEYPGRDEFSIVLPHPVDSDYVFITTGIEKKIERVKRQPNSPWEVVSERFQYIERPEDIKLKVDHTMFSPKFFIAENSRENATEFVKSSRNLAGTLKDSSGRTQKLFPREKADKISLHEFLQASNVSLDLHSGIVHHENETIRERGAVIHVSIVYSNIEDYSLFKENEIKYHYLVTRLPETGYKLTDSVSRFEDSETEDPEYLYRYLIRRYGVYIKFSQEGQLGRFSWSNLLLHFLSALGMVGLLTLAIDYFAIYMVPSFTKAKYIEMKLEKPKNE